MNKVDKIIECLDSYLEESGRLEVAPVEANEILEKKGILKDCYERKGKPLREILRDGKIPHAYQVGRFWHIPHSKREK